MVFQNLEHLCTISKDKLADYTERHIMSLLVELANWSFNTYRLPGIHLMKILAEARPGGYKTCFMLNSTERKISAVHKN